MRRAFAGCAHCTLMPSSVIRTHDYEPAKRRLPILFTTGRRYSYFAAPPEIADDLNAARSRGEFFNALILDHVSFAREA